ncbi:MAG TPA: glycosyl transferase family 2 [Chitinophagaceae bacterium]|nr:glycosyl transferase family 2 [Chitinophagaceae bacterium]
MNYWTLDFIAVALMAMYVLIHFFYYLFFFARLAFYRKDETVPVDAPFPVSLIICAFNEEANLKKNLPLWLSQQYHKNGRRFYEVIVVNDNSEDDSFYLLNQMKEKYPHLHVVHLTQEAKLIPGKKFPLSMGIKSARFEHLLLTDADCEPSGEHWLSRMARGFEGNKTVVLGYSPYIKYPGWLNKKIRFETLLTAIQYLSYALARIPYMGVGRNLAYVKTLFNANKGFSSHHHIISGDDDLFINQVAKGKLTKVVIHPEAFTRSEPKKTNEHWRFQKRRHLSTGKYYQRKHQFLLGFYAMSHFLFWLSIIPCILFHQWYLIAISLFLFRWLVQFIIFERCCTLLDEKDLVPLIWVFDFWLLFYNLANLPSILFKTNRSWK